MDEMTDASLIALMTEDPERGCEQLLTQYTGLVLGIVRRRLGGCTFCTQQDIEELTSDILFRFWQQRGRIAPERGSIRALLTTAATRHCYEWYRSHVKKLGGRTDGEIPETMPDSAQTPEETVLDGESKRQLRAAILALGEPDSEILIRKYYGGETAASIAQKLSMKTHAVEMRLIRARKKLRSMLGGEAHDD